METHDAGDASHAHRAVGESAARRVPGAGNRGRRVTAGVRAGVPVCALTLVMTLSLTACGKLLGSDDEETSRRTKGDDVTIGLMLPDKVTARYEKFDRPVIEEQVKEFTHGKGRVVYSNAEGSTHRQQTQLEAMVANKDVETVLIDAVDAKAIGPAVQKAKDAGVNVIAYDRLAEGPVDGYVTFDGDLVGQVQGQALVEAMGGKPGVISSDAHAKKIVMMNGAPNDPNTALFKKGALGELKSEVKISKTYDTPGWKAENAQAHMADAIKKLGSGNIDGIYAANDSIAQGVIAAMKSAGLTSLPPVTGQDAELPAVQRIVAGEQYMTVYKPYRDEATAAARMAVKISQGKMIEYEALALDKFSNASTEDIPSDLIQVRPMTKKSIESTVIKDKIYTVKQICTSKYEAACQEIGLD